MPPHVCFVSDTLHTYLGSGIETGVGGAERQQYKVTTALVERGYDVTVLTRVYGSLCRETVGGIDVQRVIPDIRGVHNAPHKAIRFSLRSAQSTPTSTTSAVTPSSVW